MCAADAVTCSDLFISRGVDAAYQTILCEEGWPWTGRCTDCLQSEDRMDPTQPAATQTHSSVMVSWTGYLQECVCVWDQPHMFPCDGANVVDVFDLPLVLDHPHSDRVVANLWRDVALDLEAQVFEHQVSCSRCHSSSHWLLIGGLDGLDGFSPLVETTVWDLKLNTSNLPVAIPSKSESTLIGRRWSAGMEG